MQLYTRMEEDFLILKKNDIKTFRMENLNLNMKKSRWW